MTEKSKIIFDSDCLSSFLWVKELNLLFALFGDTIKIPEAVLNEIAIMKNSRNNSFVFSDLEKEIDSEKIEVLKITVGSEVDKILEKIKSDYYIERKKEIGDGEAEMLALAKYYDSYCVVQSASNNMKDVEKIAKKEGIKNVPTMEILYMAYEKKLKTVDELNKMVIEMKNRKRMLPVDTFEEYLKTKKDF